MKGEQRREMAAADRRIKAALRPPVGTRVWHCHQRAWVVVADTPAGWPVGHVRVRVDGHLRSTRVEAMYLYRDPAEYLAVAEGRQPKLPWSAEPSAGAR